jgi:hypothetical protein
VLRLVLAVFTTLPLLVTSAPSLAETSDGARARPTTILQLTDLPMGPPPSSLYAADNVIHDGMISVAVKLTRPLRLLGRVVGGYAVQTIGSSGFYGKLYRVDPATGVATRFGRSSDLYREPRIMRGGRYVAYGTCCAPPTVSVRNVETGRVDAKRVFPGYAELVDAAGSRVMVSGEDPVRGLYWSPFRDRVAVFGQVFVVPFNADAKHGLAYVASETGRSGTCGELVRTARPARPLWRACGIAVVAFSPDARTVVTVRFDGSDGAKGLSRIEIRRTRDGVLLHAYEGVDINPLHYDGEDHLVFVAHSKGSTAVVRCDFAGGCERVSEIVAESRYEFFGLDWTFPADREGWAHYDESFYYDEY